MTKIVTPLTEDEQTFVALWDGGVSSTADAAGMPRKKAKAIFAKISVKDAIRNRELEERAFRKDKKIADRIERQEFLTALMRDTLIKADGTAIPVDLETRKAAEAALARSQGDNIQRVEHSGEVTNKNLNMNIMVDQKEVERKVTALAEKIVRKKDAGFLPPFID